MKTALMIGAALLVSTVVAALATQTAHAIDTPIAASILKVADRTEPGSSRRCVVFGSKDGAISVPPDGSAGDPTISGGSVEVFNTAGSGESMIVPLPAGNWRRIPRSPSLSLRGWKYEERVKDLPTESFEIAVLVRQNAARTRKTLKVTLKSEVGGLISYSLDESAQGSLGVRVVTGADQHCADFGGTLTQDQGHNLGDGAHRGNFSARDAPMCSCVQTKCVATVDPSDPYYDRFEATFGANDCTSDADCVASGCSGEVCAAEPVITTCEVVPKPAGWCGCLDGGCVWKSCTNGEPVWMGRPDGCLQCQLDCQAPDLQDVVRSLIGQGIDVLASMEGSLPVCLACDVCPSGRFYVVLVSSKDAAILQQQGWSAW